MAYTRPYRYVDRPGESPAAAPSPEQFPVRHWFDNRSSGHNIAETRPVASPPLRATAAAYEYNPSPAAAPPATTTSPLSTSPAPGTGAAMHSDYFTAWRAVSGAPLPGGGQPASHQHPQTHGGGSVRGGGGGWAGRRRIQARSASRGGRPQSATDARRYGGGVGGGGTVSGGFEAEGGSGVAQIPFSPMGPTSRDSRSASGGDGGGVNRAQSEVPGRWPDTHARNPANNFAGRGRSLSSREQDRDAVDVRHRVGEGNGSPRRSNAQRARRSLSDFLREIEEMVRAQREQVGGLADEAAAVLPLRSCCALFPDISWA